MLRSLISSSFLENPFSVIRNSSNPSPDMQKLPTSVQIKNSESESKLSSTPEKKLIYQNTPQRNPLCDTSLFYHIIDEETKKKLSTCITKDILSFYNIRSEEATNSKITKNSNIDISSDFDSGNLEKAYQHSSNELVVVLRPDYGNSKYTHWFYFRVKLQKPDTLTFHIVNISKQDIGLMTGMQIVVKSKDKWKRGGNNIQFRETQDFHEYHESSGYYVLSFSYSFTDSQEVSFAYSYPYTYTHLKEWLHKIEHHSNICSVSSLCRTLAGNICYMITITSKISRYFDYKKTQSSDKKAVVITGRVHPSESPSSYIVQGLVNFLLGNSCEAKILRKNFVFKIIPMVNVDGVKYGNSRCSLLGIDLNRRWIEANEILHPEIFFAKEMIKNTKDLHDLVMYCDIHSHAKKRNVFMYGCKVSSSDHQVKKKNLVTKMIPLLLAKKNSNFSYKDGHFRIEKHKESTGRIVMFKEFGITNSYTLETSFFGTENNQPFNLGDWENIGADLALSSLSLTSNLATLNCLRLALDWNRKVNKKGKKNPRSFFTKPKRSKSNNTKLKPNILIASSISYKHKEFYHSPEAFPSIQSPAAIIFKTDSCSKLALSEKLNSHKKKRGKTHRNLNFKPPDLIKTPIEVFPSIDLSKKRFSQARAKLSENPKPRQTSCKKLPTIRSSK